MGQTAQLQAVLGHGSITLPAFSRLASASADEFIIKQNGADFAADLDWSRCVPDGTKADFAPAWLGGGTDRLADAAYSLYRLKLDPTTAPASLTLTWDGAEPQQCWIGLAEWGAQSWSWTPMPAGGVLELPDPTRFADASQRCYVAAVVLGQTACSLADIGFGDLPIPPMGDGYTLFAPITDTTTYLIDMQGNVVHTWASRYAPGMSVELTESGHLLRQCVLDNPGSGGGSLAGRFEEYDWDGNLVWSYNIFTPTQITHHDFKRLPNGNILCIVRNQYTQGQMIAAGRDTNEITSQGLLIDSIMEIQPVGTDQANVVWEWYVFDHLIQDYDSAQSNYGDPGAHPELIDVNSFGDVSYFDWTHVNAVDYNPELDQILISVYCFSEVWIIDHSTTTAEAASHSGGKHGRGGDLLYRWGNPQAYRAGTAADQKLFIQHGAHWIEPGLNGAGDLLIFNNREGRNYSTVVELTPPLLPDGTYDMPDLAYGPAGFTWKYIATPPSSLFSLVFSRAQRLPGGNTLICSGEQGWLCEITPSGEIVWEYTVQTPQLRSEIFRADRYLPDYPGLAALH